MKLRLTDIAVRKLTLPEKGQLTHWDTATPGFGLRCSTKSKSFVVMFGEKRRLKTLGRYPAMSLSDARTQAKRFFVECEAGGFVPANKSKPFSEAKDRFLEDCEGRNKPRTVADYCRLLNKHFNFKGKLDEIERKHVMKVISGLSATPSEQSHAFVAIRTMMNWCVRHGLIEYSVVPQIKQKSIVRDRVLSEEEFKQVFIHAGETPYPFGPIVQLLLLTGQRRTEIGQLRRSWIEGDVVTYPVGFTKNKREHRFPLTPKTQKLISGLPNTGDLIFPAVTDVEKPLSTWAWHKARFDTGLGSVAPYTIHDLRRTFATTHAKIGTPIQVTEKLLNHVSGTISGIAAVYNQHSYENEMRAAMNKFDAFLDQLIE